MQYCPCGTEKLYPDCCGAFISGQKSPSTPEELMRSRYTAYHQADIDYIVKTMKSPAADNFDPYDAERWAKQVKWISLEVIKSKTDNSTGLVEFIAHYSLDDKKHTLHEISKFEYENGVWLYANGHHLTEKISRNDPCICGSGKKYKKCCGFLKG